VRWRFDPHRYPDSAVLLDDPVTGNGDGDRVARNSCRDLTGILRPELRSDRTVMGRLAVRYPLQHLPHAPLRVRPAHIERDARVDRWVVGEHGQDSSGIGEAVAILFETGVREIRTQGDDERRRAFSELKRDQAFIGGRRYEQAERTYIDCITDNLRISRDCRLDFHLVDDPDGRAAEAFGIRPSANEMARIESEFGPEMLALKEGEPCIMPMQARFLIGRDGIVAKSEVVFDCEARTSTRELLPILLELDAGARQVE
jgi:hypothetical protein